MATIVLHAGMPKTGSTSIQRWIVEHATRLRERHDVLVLVATSETSRNPSREVSLEPYEPGSGVNSGRLIKAWLAADRSPAISHRFVEELSHFAGSASTVLVTAEAMSQIFWRVDEPFLSGLEELGREHDVRVAYYVRPQHSALEAGWREGGYKDLRYTPAQWVVEQSKRGLHYLPTLDAVARLAPSLDFGIRPFDTELLDGGNPVEDFIRRFVSLDEVSRDVHVIPGLPLEVVNVLRYAPDGWFWTRSDVEDYPETYPRWRFTELFGGLQLSESPKIRRSRQILQQHCHQVFEDGNQQLIRRLGWPLPEFVPPADDLEDGWRLEELDALWAPEASEGERALMYQVFRAALSSNRDEEHAPLEPTANGGSGRGRLGAARDILGREGVARGSAIIVQRLVRRLRGARRRP